MNKQERNAPVKTWLALALAAAALGTAAAGCNEGETAPEPAAEEDIGESAQAIEFECDTPQPAPCYKCVLDFCEQPFNGICYGKWSPSNCGTKTLTLEKWGTGQGQVTSSPSGINCGTSCWSASKAYTTGTNVTLTATPPPGNVFARWENGCTGSSPTCTVSMTQSRTVRAVFEALVPLTVLKGGTGTGIVVDQSFGLIYCGPSQTECTLAYWMYTPVNLVPLASPGSYFAGWSGGGCTGTGPCTVTVDVAKSVTAYFNAL